MRPQDRSAFSKAASELKYWILVRHTNPASLQYIGRTGYVPKPIECKAKTANIDRPGRPLAGLVTDPNLCPLAFIPAGRDKKVRCWQQFYLEQHVNQRQSKFTVVMDEGSPHFGAVQFNGCFVHGDYDLYDIVDPKRPKANLGSVETLHGQKHMRGFGFYSVQRIVNGEIGVPMVQHGGEMQYADHSNEDIDAFTPLGEYRLISAAEIPVLYAGQFEGRRPIGGEPYYQGSEGAAPKGQPGWTPVVHQGGKT